MGRALAAIGVVLGAGLLWLYVKTKDGASEGEPMTIVDKLRSGSVPDSAKQYADEIVRGASESQPIDYNDGLEDWTLLLIAVAQHESGFGLYPGYEPRGAIDGWGDRGNAFGFWQIDKRYHGSFIYGDDTSVAAQAKYAGGILAERWDYFEGYDNRKGLTVASYNASMSRLKRMVDSGASFEEVDATTTQRHGYGYAASVLIEYSSYA